MLEKFEQLDPFDDHAVSDLREDVRRLLLGRRRGKNGMSRL